MLAFIWGWSFLFIKVAVEGMTPTTVAAARIGLGMAVLLALLRLRGQPLPRDRTAWRHFAVAGLIGNVVPFTLLAWGEERITSALTAVLNASTPLFTAIFVATLLGERLRPSQLAGLAIGLGGVAVAAGVGSSDLGDSSLLGAGASVGAGAFYGLAFTYMKKHLTQVPPLVAAAGQLTAGTVMLAPVAVATSAANGIDLSARRVLAILALGVVGTGLAYVLNYRIIAELGPTKASLVTYVIPPIAVAVGVVVLGEPFHLRLVAGGAIIVLGIALVQQRLRVRRLLPGAVGTGLLGLLVLLVLLPVLLLACGSGGERAAGNGGCGSVRRERVHEGSTMHLLPGAPEPSYLTDPPTSGPHLTGRLPSGVVDEPVARPAQVALLERGDVLVQHDGVAAADIPRLEALAGNHVVVAPHPDLPAPVVATAWTTKLECRAVDVDALQAFVDEHGGRGPEGGH